MGGPTSLHGERDGVQAFLRNLFTDPDIVQLGRFQNIVVGSRRRRRFWSCPGVRAAAADGCGAGAQGSLLARRRAPVVIEQYRSIGGEQPAFVQCSRRVAADSVSVAGKSPIAEWTAAQGAALSRKLDALRPEARRRSA